MIPRSVMGQRRLRYKVLFATAETAPRVEFFSILDHLPVPAVTSGFAKGELRLASEQVHS